MVAYCRWWASNSLNSIFFFLGRQAPDFSGYFCKREYPRCWHGTSFAYLIEQRSTINEVRVETERDSAGRVRRSLWSFWKSAERSQRRALEGLEGGSGPQCYRSCIRLAVPGCPNLRTWG